MLTGYAALFAVNAATGKWWMAFLSLGGIPVFGAITALRLAKPGSLRDRKWNSSEKQLRSAARFSNERPASSPIRRNDDGRTF